MKYVPRKISRQSFVHLLLSKNFSFDLLLIDTLASFIGSDMKFDKLSDDLKVMATEHLNYDDKFKLIEIFPPIINQIHTFDMNRHNPAIDNNGEVSTQPAEEHFDKVIELFKKLTKVNRIITPSKEVRKMRGFSKLNKAVINSSNLNIELFYRMHEHSKSPTLYQCRGMGPEKCIDHFSQSDIGTITGYIENARKRDPLYDGSRIKCALKIDHRKVYNLVYKYQLTELKLDYSCGEHSFWFPSESVRVGDILFNLMVTRFKPRSDKEFNGIPRSMIFESITHLDLTGLFIAVKGVVGRLERYLRHIPNLTKLAIGVNMKYNYAYDPQELTNCICSIPKLESLSVEFQSGLFEQQHINKIIATVPLLLATRHRPLLTSLNVRLWWTKYQLTGFLAMDIKDGFKYLRIENPEARFTVRNKKMTICHCKPSLVDMFNRFNRVNFIKVTTASDDYAHQIEQEIDTIRANLPRNRCVQLDVHVKSDGSDSEVDSSDSSDLSTSLISSDDDDDEF